uniref:Butyrophilin subfamily 1 member A1-like n=1 Tax=Pelusios castaneus TaxID=367368 RepID=A0A8C8REE6_9SAUR
MSMLQNLGVLDCLKETFKVIGPDYPVMATAGEDIVLPCHLTPRVNAENMEVRWYRSQFYSLVHLYRDGDNQNEQQMPEYQGRTEFLRDDITNGNVSLRIRSVRPSDEGQYRCFFRSSVFHEESVLELKVAGQYAYTASIIYADISLSFSTAANVTMDPNTANAQLIVSEDRKSVRRGIARQEVPDNPERFHSFCLLGCERFTSGRHYWEVEVGDGGFWAVGVARESMRRKGGIRFNPEQGIWAVERCGDQYRALTSPETPMPLSEKPKKIGVYLDYETEWVAFYDMGNETLIFTFTSASFTGETVLPFFWVGIGTSQPHCPTDNSDGLQYITMVLERRRWKGDCREGKRVRTGKGDLRLVCERKYLKETESQRKEKGIKKERKRKNLLNITESHNVVGWLFKVSPI